MRRVINYLMFLLMTVLLIGLFSCEEEDTDDDNGQEDNQPEVVGEWRLIQVLADPGDGSGTFHDVVSEKKVSFFSDSTFRSNYSMCSMNTPAEDTVTGTYTLQDSVLFPDECAAEYTLRMSYDAPNLILQYPCFEPCAEKYERIE